MSNYFTPDWGKPWTYLVISVLWMAIAGFIWAMVEQRRDDNAIVFYKVAEDNYRQIDALKAYAWADSSNCLDRTAVKAMLRQTLVVKTRRQMDSIQRVKDSLAQDTTQVQLWDLEPGNFYPHGNAARPYGSSIVTGFTGFNGGTVSITARATVGSSAIEIDGGGENAGADTSFSVYPSNKYVVEFDAHTNTVGPAQVEILVDNALQESFKLSDSWQTFVSKDIIGANTITLRYIILGASQVGQEIYTDGIEVSKYDKISP